MAFGLVGLTPQGIQQPGGGGSPSTTGSTAGSTTGGSTTGGGTTGSPQGGWVVEFSPNDGKVIGDGQTTLWKDLDRAFSSDWYSSPNQVGGYLYSTTMPPSKPSTAVTSTGSPKIRLRWTGSGSPPAEAWLLVDAQASYSSTNGSGGANNGFQYDQSAPIPNGFKRQGRHVLRLSGGTERVWSSQLTNAYATATSTGIETQTVGAQILIEGSLANKNASLTRVDGGAFNSDSKDAALVADTLLSWHDDGDAKPGPTYQTLKGVYGGTWNTTTLTTASGTIPVDYTTVKWTDADPEIIYSVSPTSTTPDIRTTTYPTSATGGKMPLADLSACGTKSQTWKYTVLDHGDQTDLALTCKWICHFAYEGFAAYPNTGQLISTGQASPDYVVYLTGATPSGNAPVTASQFVLSTSFSVANGGQTNLPGFDATSKHVGIPAFQSRAGQTTAYTWPASNSPQTWSEIFGDGNYGLRKKMYQRMYTGTVTCWNKQGQSGQQALTYFLDNQGAVQNESIFPFQGL